MSEKNYYSTTKSAFDAFVAGQSPAKSLKDATAKAIERVKSGELNLTDEDPAVIIELTNTIRKSAPRVVTEGFAVESNRKLGPRPKKEEAPATDVVPEVATSEPAPATEATPTATSSRRTRSNTLSE